jgi:hypothetical protein
MKYEQSFCTSELCTPMERLFQSHSAKIVVERHQTTLVTLEPSSRMSNQLRNTVRSLNRK